MDNLTHTLTGLMLSRAGLDRFHPRASWILMIAANAPDFDAVSVIGGAVNYFHYHRWITHALIAIPFVALLPPLLVRLFFRKEPFRWLSAWALSVAGVCSHLLLDFTNPYGIRLFLPFDDSWPMLASTSVIDIWIWSILLLAVAAPLLGRLVGSEIGSKPSRSRGWAIFALTALLLYDVTRVFLQRRAVLVQESRIYNGEAPRRVLAYPSQLNPLVWEGVVETNSFFATHTVDLSRQSPVRESRIHFKPESTPAIEAAAQTPLFRQLAAFSKALLWRATPAPGVEGVTRVEATDLYFGFAVTAAVDSSNQVLSTKLSY